MKIKKKLQKIEIILRVIITFIIMFSSNSSKSDKLYDQKIEKGTWLIRILKG